MEMDPKMCGRIDVNSLPFEDRDEIFNFCKAKRVDLQTFGNYIESVCVNHSDLTYKEIIKSAITLYNNELLSKKSQKTDAPVKRKIFPFEEMIKKMTNYLGVNGLTKEDREFSKPVIFSNLKTLKLNHEDQSMDIEECDGRTEDSISLNFEKENIIESYDHWNLSAERRTEVLNNQFEEYIEQYKNETGLSHFSPLGGTSPEVVTIAGRVVNTDPDVEFKSSIELINLSKENEHGRTKVKLNLDDLKEPVILFEGQIIIAEGTSDQDIFNVQSIKTLPIEKEIPKNDQMENGTLSVYAFCGPYSFSDSLNYTLLKQIVKIIQENKPHFVIMTGPFVDINNEYVKTGEFLYTNDEEDIECFEDLDIYAAIKSYLQTAVNKSNTQICIIPSLNDMTSMHPFPQPPLTTQSTSNVHFLPNPARFSLNGVKFGIVNADVIKMIMSKGMSRDLRAHKLVHTAEELAKQRSFYPVYPLKDDTPIDISQYKLYEMRYVPDILITVSDLIQFAEFVDDKFVVLNPGGCIKGKTPGTFASITLRIDSELKNVTEKIRIDLKQIKSDN